jgi:hypothetical protein
MSDKENERPVAPPLGSNRESAQTQEPEPEQKAEAEALSEALTMVLNKLQAEPLKLISGLAQIEKHADKQIVMSIPRDEHPRKRAYAEFAKWWFSLEEASTPYHVSCAVEQFMDALMNKEQPHIYKLLGAVKTAYKSAEAKPITGANRYDSDLSPLDKRYIRRKRR